MFKKLFRPKEKISGTIVDFGFNKDGKAVAMLEIKEGNLYDLMAHLKYAKNQIKFSFKVKKHPGSNDGA